MLIKSGCLALALFGLMLLEPTQADAFPPTKTTILDEEKVPPYEIPPALGRRDGTLISTPAEWFNEQRPALLELFTEQVYGKAPPAPAAADLEYTVLTTDPNAFGGKAICKQVEIVLAKKEGLPPLKGVMLLYIPKSDKPVPAFIGLNFFGNHATTPDSTVLMNTNWMRNRPEKGFVNHRATEQSRGANASRWPYEMAIDRGYAVGTMYYGDIDPDVHDGFQNGLHPYFYKPGQTEPAADEWGSIGAWTYGLSRMLDYLEHDPAVDAKKVGVVGHSRLGKTSLWAGATDPRFALVVSNDSGCTGAALSRRIFGEVVKDINKNFPHWCCGNYRQYTDNENAFPGDQHMLLALIAPRPLYVASATEDLWADPKGEFLSAVHADPVYRLLGTDGLGGSTPPSELPAPDQPIQSGIIGYHVRTGKHDITAYDWEQYLNFADRHVKGKQ